MKTEITEDDIQSGAVLAAGRVYKLVGWRDDAIVIKMDSSVFVTAQQLDVARRAMKQVDPAGGDAKVMTANERRAVKDFVGQYTLFASRLTDCRMAAYATSSGVPEWAQALGENIDAGLWYKMPLRNVADLEQALGARMHSTPDKGLLTEFQRALTSPGGFESLGKIVACDLINGNTDRFYPKRGVTKTFGGVSFAFRALVNIGNVFIAGTGTSRSLTGMDFFESQAIFRMYERTIADIGREYDERWTGEHLIDRALRRAFCKDIVWDLNLILSGGNPKGRTPLGKRKTWVGDDARDRLERGMILGGRQVRDGLTQKYAGRANRPAGLDSRLRALDGL